MANDAIASDLPAEFEKQRCANALSYGILEEQLGASLAKVDGTALTEKQMYAVIPPENRIPKYVVDIQGVRHAVYVYRAKSKDSDVLSHDLKEIAAGLVNAQKALANAASAGKVKKDFVWAYNVVHVLVAGDKRLEALAALCEKAVKEQKSISAVKFLVTKTKAFLI